MRNEKIFKNNDGSRVKVIVGISKDCSGPIKWTFSVTTCEPRKRTWKSPVDHNCYSYRKMSMEERRQFQMEEYLKLISEDMLMEVANELHEMIKPEFLLKTHCNAPD